MTIVSLIVFAAGLVFITLGTLLAFEYAKFFRFQGNDVPGGVRVILFGRAAVGVIAGALFVLAAVSRSKWLVIAAALLWIAEGLVRANALPRLAEDALMQEEIRSAGKLRR